MLFRAEISDCPSTLGHPYTPPEPRLSSWPASPSLGDCPLQLTSLPRNTLQAVLRPRLFACLSAHPLTVPPPWSAGHLPTKFSLSVTNSTVARSPTTIDDLQRPQPRCPFIFCLRLWTALHQRFDFSVALPFSALQVAPSSRAHPLACSEPRATTPTEITSPRRSIHLDLASSLVSPQHTCASTVRCCLTHKLHCLFVGTPATHDWPTHPGLALSDVDSHDCLSEIVFLTSLAICLDRASKDHILFATTLLCA